MKKLLAVLVLFTVLGLLGYALGDVTRLERKAILVQGTIQGLQGACMEMFCRPGQENIVAALEDGFVLVVEDGRFYNLPNLKPTLLARYIARLVRVEGNEVLGGRAIIVLKADVMEGGQWTTFWSPEIADLTRQRQATP